MCRRSASLLFAFMSLASAASAEEPQITPSPERGAVVYAQHCQTCHQADGTGRVGVLPMAANFVEDRERMARSDEELLQSIAQGKRGKIGQMPAWQKLLTEQERADALAYIRKQFVPSSSPIPQMEDSTPDHVDARVE